MASTSAKLKVLRNVLKELRHLSGYKGGLQTRNLYGYKYILEKYRISRNVDDKLARELSYNAENYLCLLKSIREKQHLQHMYKGEGERPIEEVAQIVGFKMPELYQDSDNHEKK